MLRGEAAWIRHRRQAGGVEPGARCVGLALSGGGIRAAAAARGFIEGLQQQGLLTRFDYLSAVSGGGYTAASFTEHVGRLGKPFPFERASYPLASLGHRWSLLTCAGMAREAARTALPPLLYFFWMFATGLPILGHRGALVSWLPLLVTCMLMGLAYCWPGWWARRLQTSAKDFRSVLQGFGLAFLLGGLAAYFRVTEVVPVLVAVVVAVSAALVSYMQRFPHRPHAGRLRKAWVLLWVAIWSSAGLLVAAVMSLLNGLGRGVVLTSLAGLLLLTGATLAHGSHRRVVDWNRGNAVFKRYRDNLAAYFLPFRWLSISRLSSLKPHWNPYPIFNAAANDGVSLSEFELAPLFCGSAVHGRQRTAEWLPDLSLADAMAISGSAVDILAARRSLLAFLGALADGTGYWIPRLHARDPRGPKFVAHHLLLLGLEQKLALRLSDGGFVDNLGVLAMIQRRVPFIVCLDAGYDPGYEFEDLRRLCVLVAARGWADIELPDMAAARAAFRFRQRRDGVLHAKVRYPARDGQEAAEADLYLVKLYPVLPLAASGFDDFPHYTTVDQGLTQEEVGHLHAAGLGLADQVSSHLKTAGLGARAAVGGAAIA